jgi:hypothetical protein
MKGRTCLLLPPDLIEAGCTLRDLIKAGWTKAELICLYRSHFRLFATVDGHDGAVSGILSTLKYPNIVHVIGESWEHRTLRYASPELHWTMTLMTTNTLLVPPSPQRS